MIVRDHKHISWWEMEEKVVIGGMKDGVGFGSMTGYYVEWIGLINNEIESIH